jgi:hypothetical protein
VCKAKDAADDGRRKQKVAVTEIRSKIMRAR